MEKKDPMLAVFGFWLHMYEIHLNFMFCIQDISL